MSCPPPVVVRSQKNIELPKVCVCLHYTLVYVSRHTLRSTLVMCWCVMELGSVLYEPGTVDLL